MGKKETIKEINEQEADAEKENIKGIVVFVAGIFFLFIPFIGWILGLVMCISGAIGANKAHSRLEELRLEKAKLK